MAMKLQVTFLLMCGCILHALTAKGIFASISLAPLNRVVYERAINTTISCESTGSVMEWYLSPFSYTELFDGWILALNGEIEFPYNDSFAIDHSQGGKVNTLVIFNATISPSERATFSTAGIYQCFDPVTESLFTHQLVVIRSDPICSSNFTQSTAKLQSDDVIQLSCTIVYGGHRQFPIDAIMNWSVDGQPIPPTNSTFTINSSRTKTTATSTLVVNPNSDATYECATTFSQPARSPFSNKAPDYYKTCTILISQPNAASTPPTTTTTTGCQSTSSQQAMTSSLSPSTTTTDYPCEPNLKNLAVFEGQLNIMMNMETDPQSVTWSLLPSSNEYSLQNIIDIGCNKNPSLIDLYDVKDIGLVIKKATVTGDPISTAGLYVGKCADSADNVGAKLLVVRTGPQCSRTTIDTSSPGVSCNITFADSTIHPIYPIVTWKLNGEFLSSYTLWMVRIDPVFYAESTIETNGGSNDNYQCEMAFDAPINIEYPWIATNAPEFKGSCSITG